MANSRRWRVTLRRGRISQRRTRRSASLQLCLLLVLACSSDAASVTGWLNWRGPEQNGSSRETSLPDVWQINGTNHLWTVELSGRGTPVVANGKLYIWGYVGEGPDLQEVLLCLDAETGKKNWEARFNDFLSDIVYDRYSIGAPTVDDETGNVYILTSASIFAAFSGDGKKLWEHSLMEEIGKLTFPNGRTGSPVIDDDLVIIHGITSNWGAQGPGADRFYAFDKRTGLPLWTSTPGTVPPKDSSFSTAVVAGNKLYCGTGDGSVVCLNPHTGQPIWRYKISAGGVNSSVVLWNNLLVAGHADENLDSSEIGRIVAVNIDAKPAKVEDGVGIFDRSAEAWRISEELLTSSPVVVGDRVYLVNKTGELLAIDAGTGKVLWRRKLGADQLHASPLYADGKLYIPMRYAGFYIIRPTDKGAEILSHTPFDKDEEALGAPAAWNGKIYVQTVKRLYCFGSKRKPSPMPGHVGDGRIGLRLVAQIQVVPNEILLRPGQKQSFILRGLDEYGRLATEFKQGQWEKFIPPTAKVRSEMDAEFNEAGELEAKPTAKVSAGAWEVTVKEGDKELKGYMRGRVLPNLPFKEDFESFEPKEQPDMPAAGKFDWPPLPWIGARFKWDIRELDGNKVLAKTIDNIFFQRAYTFIGAPDMKNYTVEADVMSEGGKRNMSNVGVINQRYVINLVGNWQQLEVLSNQERVKVAVPFKWSPNVWYHLKTRVDVASDGSGIVRAKVWKRGDSEPDAWTIEVPHKHAHHQGSPGVYGFAPQSQFRVYLDNIVVRPNE